jgi:hypothetical protein
MHLIYIIWYTLYHFHCQNLTITNHKKYLQIKIHEKFPNLVAGFSTAEITGVWVFFDNFKLYLKDLRAEEKCYTGGGQYRRIC